MLIATLTTDFGTDSYSLAAFKGTLLSWHKELTLIDITNNVERFDIVQGAFMLKNTFNTFPKGTVHIISIHDYYAKDRCYLALRYNDHYFLGPDNGIFSVMFGPVNTDIYELEYDQSMNVPVTEIYSKAVGHLASGMPFNEIGIPVESIQERISIQPVTTATQIRGTIVYIDNYENAVVNINRELFDKIGKGRPFEILFRRHEPLSVLASDYADAPLGEPLCLFNDSDYLEIAINTGKAASLLGLSVDDMIQIDFKEQ